MRERVVNVDEVSVMGPLMMYWWTLPCTAPVLLNMAWLSPRVGCSEREVEFWNVCEMSQLLRLDTSGGKVDVGFSSKVKGGVVGAEEYAALRVFFFEEDFDV